METKLQDSLVQHAVSDVAKRLRASQERLDAEAYSAGLASGYEFASSTADVDALENLEALRKEIERSGGCARWMRGEKCPRNEGRWLLFFTIYPHTTDDQYDAECFWNRLLPKNLGVRDRPALLDGFVDGALALWNAVQTQM